MRCTSTRPLISIPIHNGPSIEAIIAEQGDLRKVVEDLASRPDRSQETSGTSQNELSTNVLLEINDLKSKVSRLTEQNTQVKRVKRELSQLLRCKMKWMNFEMMFIGR